MNQRLPRLSFRTLAILVTFVLSGCATTPRDKCDIAEYDKSSEFALTIDKILNAKVTLGPKWSQTNKEKVDEIHTDYTKMYRSLCQDYEYKRITQEYFQCRRSHMDSVLVRLREFRLSLESPAVSAAKGGKVPEVVERAQAKLIEEAGKAKSTDLCLNAAALETNVSNLEFNNANSQRSFKIINGSNHQKIGWWVKEPPQGFLIQPNSGELAATQSANVEIYQLASCDKKKTHDLKVASTTKEEKIIRLSTAKGLALRKAGRGARLANAVHQSVAQLFPKENEPVKWAATGRILFEKNEYALSAEAFDKAAQAGPGPAQDPMTYYGLALSNFKLGNSEQALKNFEALGKSDDFSSAAAYHRGAILLTASPEPRQLCSQNIENMKCNQTQAEVDKEVQALVQTVPAPQRKSVLQNLAAEMKRIYGATVYQRLMGFAGSP